MRQLIRNAGAKLLFLPKYSPDLNPIEEFFSKIKHWLREAKARSLIDLTAALKDIQEKVSPKECANFFAHSGYDPI